MKNHRHTVLRQADVELDSGNTGLRRRSKRGDRVLEVAEPVAAM